MRLTFLVLGKIVIAKIPTTRNLCSPIQFIRIASEQISSVTENSGDSATVLKNVNTAISPRLVFTFNALFAVSPQVAKIQAASAIHITSVEFPTLLATPVVDGLLICGAVRAREQIHSLMRTLHWNPRFSNGCS
ncbi:hypothetical protein [Ulvibacterium sp.]|uniref:hypothetical protein n=1 Tax=Ulvibacterium sp. TaxID=2665914 RepID=UPI002639C4C6|nr:hypothetical protein [Ulvibacterium sp.]